MNLSMLCMCVTFISASSVEDEPAWQKGNLFEGDIDMSREELQQLIDSDNRLFQIQQDPDTNVMDSALREPSLLWSGGRVPFALSSHFSRGEKRKIAAAFERFHSETCLRFVPKSDSDSRWVDINSKGGCSSWVGRSVHPGPQGLSLGRGCLGLSTILHELMHAVGFHHEQTRADRDDHVTVYFENIKPNKGYNFEKYSLDRIQHLDAPYDYGSVMHYSRRAFSKNGEDTIRRLRSSGPEIGSAPDFSHWDIVKINRLYKCSELSTSCYSEEANTAYESEDSHIRTIHGLTIAQCKVKCDEEEHCQGINYWPKPQQCNLKNAMHETGRYSSDHYDAYIKGCSGSRDCYAKEAHTAYETDDSHMRTVHGISVGECREKCDAEPRCRGLNYWPEPQQCNLKNAMRRSGRYSSQYYHAYIKAC